MHFTADFHIHSHYSRATSREMNLISLTKWGQLKGLNVIGTGDFTHPRYFQEIQETLEPAEDGLFKLKESYSKKIQKEVPDSCKNPMRYLLSVEISSIYKKNDKVRKVHNIVIMPKIEDAAKLNIELGKRGNIKSDGRPILGLDSKELLKIVLSISEDAMLIPAHIWTPHFAVMGSASGFDSLEECFDELTPYIYALETGLSSDPAMNYRLNKLKNIALISNSDCHSAYKLGREANIFNTDLSYYAITNALKKNDTKAFESTIEFFPEEGKYHLDGHRACNVRLTPKETIANNYLCPKCGKKVTIGVMHRIELLADKDEGFLPEKNRPFKSIIPLPEVIAEVFDLGVASKKVDAMHHQMLRELGNEFHILLDAELKDIEKASSGLIAEAISRMRKGKISINPGYDGEFGTIKIFEDKERETLGGRQETLF